MDLRNALRGVSCPTVTPFDDGAIDEDALVDLLAHLREGGIDSVFACGTSGEFPSLGPEERRRVIELTVDHADGPVVACSGATSVDEAVTHVDNAADAGADAAALVPPYFTPANAPEGNERFFERVAAETTLPIVLYNIPQYTGERIEPETVAALAEREAFVGIKDSSGDLTYFQSLVRETPDEFLCLMGYDSLLVPSIRLGGDGGINALSNVVPRTFAETVETADTDRGQQLQSAAIAPLFETCGAYGFAQAAKTGLVQRDVLPSDEVRPPLVATDDEAAAEIESTLENALAVTER
ncbi:dihydrodipicolinate synthase family protein [Natronococcus occultus]|uniref:Dihydrodipicolinate synthase/N-acetylneuraminate lyase n=1 Tax=Natronococcus occultus SP4 TaxID=694430 RepID=L0JX93_9EURY|nr:dihydrodipicolinate synthase family protein [Natronococcus occultus]AGB37371.1 dihydrodipicolinate synthase/N-acetylneuraminate lyase [Natronococcus occultus SP4]